MKSTEATPPPAGPCSQRKAAPHLLPTARPPHRASHSGSPQLRHPVFIPILGFLPILMLGSQVESSLYSLCFGGSGAPHVPLWVSLTPPSVLPLSLHFPHSGFFPSSSSLPRAPSSLPPRPPAQGEAAQRPHGHGWPWRSRFGMRWMRWGCHPSVELPSVRNEGQAPSLPPEGSARNC